MPDAAAAFAAVRDLRRVRRRSVGRAAELLGRHAHAPLEVLAEERRVGEVELVGDLLDGELPVRLEQVLGVQDDRVVDPPRRAVARDAAHDRREVFGRDAEPAGVVADLALAVVVLRDEKEKLPEHRFLTCLRAHRQRFAVAVDVEDLVVDHHRQVTGDLGAVGVAVGFELAEHAAVFEHAAQRGVVERDAGVVLDEEEERGGRRDLHLVRDIDLEDDAVGLEIVALVVDLHQHVGEEDAQIAFLDAAAVLIERDAGVPLHADADAACVQFAGQIVGFGEFRRAVVEVQQPEGRTVRRLGIGLCGSGELSGRVVHVRKK